jgi:transposase
LARHPDPGRQIDGSPTLERLWSQLWSLTGDGPVVDALLEAGVTVVVITPRQIKNLGPGTGRQATRTTGSGACVLADVLRTDRARLRPLIRLAFLARSGCQDRAGWLSGKRLAAWLKAAGYSGRTDPAASTSG